MSVEFLNIDEDENKRTVYLTMKSGGVAYLSIMGGVDDNGHEEIESYCLTADDRGRETARSIAAALEAWANLRI